MAVADPGEIGCARCGAAPGEKCRTVRAIPMRTAHAIRRADATLEHVEAGWIPGDGAQIIDFEEARRRKLAEANGVILPS